MRVLYLTEWYPHKYDQMYGLFVRKHAVAAATAGTEVIVLYLHKDPTAQATHIERHEYQGVYETIVYYRHNYLHALRLGWHDTKKRYGMPDLCQINVISKNALLALMLRCKHKIPYIIIEHWSGYLEENGQAAKQSALQKRFVRLVAANAKYLLTVSQTLENAMKRHNIKANYQHIDNVVDDFFYTTPKQSINLPPTNLPPTIVHISCFDEAAKNVCGIIDAYKILKDRGYNYTLQLVGTGKDLQRVKDYASHLRLDDIQWLGEKTPTEVSLILRQATVSVIFSRYETCCVVIAESLASGTPVISTPVGIATEEISPNNGLIVKQNDITALADAINHIVQNQVAYNSQLIRQQALHFATAEVGKKLFNFYEDTTKNLVD